METGATPPVDTYPFLKLIPERFLGNWVLRVTKVKKEMESLYSDMVNHVLSRRKKVGSKDSFMDRVLNKNDKLGLSQHQLYFLGGVMMKAQKEINAIIGEDRSPVWSDYSKLPYVAAIVKEAMRWRPVTPLSFPHCLADDEWVDGKFLPKGTILIINVWGLHHDEAQFPNPEIFDPDHYAGWTLLAPKYAASADYKMCDHYGYGAGRRLCPGIHLGERNLFLAISKLLWAFSFDKQVDEAGKVIELDVDPVTGYSEGFLVCANLFPCRITLRSEARQDTIMREFAQAQADIFSKFKN
ncbi:hypothetical protein VTN00DRAFT_9632 [Thermoascus crustaceus]|uniref:uncharacterized protein n=1 Tax=Thermoascus crustaceus TaxID=5088 RepID=UPI0037431803